MIKLIEGSLPWKQPSRALAKSLRAALKPCILSTNVRVFNFDGECPPLISYRGKYGQSVVFIKSENSILDNTGRPARMDEMLSRTAYVLRGKPAFQANQCLFTAESNELKITRFLYDNDSGYFLFAEKNQDASKDMSHDFFAKAYDILHQKHIIRNVPQYMMKGIILTDRYGTIHQINPTLYKTGPKEDNEIIFNMYLCLALSFLCLGCPENVKVNDYTPLRPEFSTYLKAQGLFSINDIFKLALKDPI